MNNRNETKMAATIDMRPGFALPGVRKFGRALMTRAHSNRSRRRLFIAISAFEILDFPVRARMRGL